MRQQIKNTDLGIEYIEMLLIKAIVKKYPNDTDLGQEIRRLYTNDTDLGRVIRELYRPKEKCNSFYTYDDMNMGEERWCATCGQPESKH